MIGKGSNWVQPKIAVCKNRRVSDQIFRENCANFFHHESKQDWNVVKGRGRARRLESKTGTPTTLPLEFAAPPCQSLKNANVRGEGDVAIESHDELRTEGQNKWEDEIEEIGRQLRNEILKDARPAKSSKVDVSPQAKAQGTQLSRSISLKPIISSGRENKNDIILAVDATPVRVGGLLRLPGKERTIYYYSIDWTSTFKFPDDSTKFEMVNTALALDLFETYITGYRRKHYTKLIVKTDSHFYESYKGFKHEEDVAFLNLVIGKVTLLGGEVHHALRENDADIINADYLSRSQIIIGLKAGYEEGKDEETAGDYTLINLSDVAKNYFLKILVDVVPQKYRRGFR